MSWLKWAIGTAFLWAIQSVSTYYFTTITLINSVAVNTFTRGIGLLCVICYIVISGLSSKVQKDIGIILSTDIFFMIVSSILMLLGNVFLYMSYAKIPHNKNASVATGLSNICIIISTMLSYLFLNGTLSLSSGFGIMVCFIALSIATTGGDISAIFSHKHTKHNGQHDKNGVGHQDHDHQDHDHQDHDNQDHDHQDHDNQDHDNQGRKKNKHSNWITYALYSAVFYGLGMFSTLALAKYGKTLNSISSSMMIILIEFIIGIIIYFSFKNKSISKTYAVKKYGLHNYSRDLDNLCSNKKFILNGILNGICEAGGLFGLLNSYKGVSNGGMADAITGSYAIIQAPLLYAVYNTPLQMRTMLGLLTQGVGMYFIQK